MNETKENTKQITCPDCGGTALLDVYPSKTAGVWECQNPECGVSDTCEHPDTVHEIIEADTMRNGEHDTYNTEVEICQDCGVQVG